MGYYEIDYDSYGCVWVARDTAKHRIICYNKKRTCCINEAEKLGYIWANA